MTLQEVWKATGVSVPTLSRIERGDAKGLLGETLITLSNWIGTSAKLWRKADAVTAPPMWWNCTYERTRIWTRRLPRHWRSFRAAYDQVKRKG